MTQEQLQLVIQIDTYVTRLYAKGGTDEDLLMTMQPYLPLFKRLLDTTKQGEMDTLCQRYDGFYTFAKMLENLAGAIRDGVITVPPE